MFWWVHQKLLSVQDFKNAESAFFQALISPFFKEHQKIYHIGEPFSPMVYSKMLTSAFWSKTSFAQKRPKKRESKCFESHWSELIKFEVKPSVHKSEYGLTVCPYSISNLRERQFSKTCLWLMFVMTSIYNRTKVIKVMKKPKFKLLRLWSAK